MGPGSSLCEWKKPARTDNATGPVRESIGGTRLFHAPDLVPDLGAVRLLQKQTADDKGHARHDHWIVQSGMNCALDERFVKSRRAESLRPVARLERVLRVQNVKMVPPSDSVCQRPMWRCRPSEADGAPRSRIRKGSANVRLAQNVKIVPNSLRHECA